LLIQAPKGTQDVLPQDSGRWQKIEQNMRDVCALAGYREIRTPVFEHTELFQRGVGDTTDVVQKEMYTFLDKGGRSITLKPEGTAGAVRAALQAHLFAEALPVKLYYISTPVFRYEKPQSGRLREHHQLGVEVFGGKDASLDAEVIRLATDVLLKNGIDGLRLSINSIGCPVCRKTYNAKLKEFLEPKLPSLCGACRERFERNPLRILDCKEPSCQAQLEGAPETVDCLCDDCQRHFDSLKAHLDALGLQYAVDPRIVRGLDYYTKTVFEIIADTPGGKLTVCGGGRYDGLVEQLGGAPTYGIGFGMGVERILMTQDMRGIREEEKSLYEAFVCTLGEEARIEGSKIVRELRESGISCDLDHAARSLKAQFKYCNKLGVKTVLIVAGDELAQGVVKLRNMETGEEEIVPRGKIVSRVKKG
jgi:histidyl-tRNA synthetase